MRHRACDGGIEGDGGDQHARARNRGRRRVWLFVVAVLGFFLFMGEVIGEAEAAR